MNGSKLCGILVRAYAVRMKTLEEMIRELPPDAQRQVLDYVRQLSESMQSTPKRKLNQSWAGALRLLRPHRLRWILQQPRHSRSGHKRLFGHLLPTILQVRLCVFI